MTDTLSPVLPVTRLALLRAHQAGATAQEIAHAAGWSVERVERELAAVDQQLRSALAASASPASGGPVRDRSVAPGRPAPHGRPLAGDRAQGQQPGQTAAFPERPRLAEGVVIEPPPPAGDHRVVHNARSGRYLRIKLPQAAFLEGLDGSRTLAEIADQPAGIPPAMVTPLLARFASLGLLEGADPPATPAAPRYIVKLVTLRPDAVMRVLSPVARVASSPPVLICVSLLAISGLVAVAIHTPPRLLHSHLLGDSLFITSLAVAFVLTTMLHELGHAGAVSVFGGRVRQMGVMLFYLLPAMFCDTSDAWRFPYRWQRVVVATAGIGTQLAVTGIVTQVLWFSPGPAVTTWICIYALANVGMCAYNLIPLVKLDGYWAITAALDRPNLRTQAIARAARGWRGGDWGLALYGVACAAFGPALIIFALVRWESLLVGLGWAGSTLWCVLLVAVLARSWRAVAQAPRAPLAITAVAIAAALVFVPVHQGGAKVSLARHVWTSNVAPVVDAFDFQLP